MAQPQSSPTEKPTVRTAYRVCDIPSRLRPREEVERRGVQHVADDVLLAILIRSGVKGTNVVDLARNLLTEYGSLTNLASAPIEDIAATHGMGKVKAQVLAAALELAKRLSEEAIPGARSLKTPEDVAQTLREEARTLKKERFWVLLLNAKNQMPRPPVLITEGLLDASLVHPREVFEPALRSATAAIVLAHNHPSGDPTPSAEDIRVTKQIVAAGKIIKIDVLDHVVIGKPTSAQSSDFVSMREAGLVTFS